MSLRVRFFKLPKHNVYNYKPRYWDPEKEDLEDRLKKVEDLQNGSIDAVKSRIAGGGFKQGFRRGNHNWSSQYRRKQIARSNYILLITFAILAILAVYLLLRYMPSLSNIFN